MRRLGLENHRRDINKIVQEGTRWWVLKAMDRAIAGAIVDGLTELLTKLRQPESEARQKFTGAIRDLVHELADSPERRTEVNAAKDRLLSHPNVRAWVASIWHGAVDLAIGESKSLRPARERQSRASSARWPAPSPTTGRRWRRSRGQWSMFA